MSNLYSVGQMNQLADALELSGFTSDDVTKLRNYPQLKDLLKVVRCQAEITVKNHIINCDINPYLPDGWGIEEHIKGGEFHWNLDNVKLHLCDEQEQGSIEGNKLRKKLKTQPILNACVLDYLLANPQLIPEEWKGKYVFFWGTIYRRSGGRLFVRFLYWDGVSWDWGDYWLGYDWGGDGPAVVSCK